MSIQDAFTTHRGPVIWLLASAVAISIWATMGSASDLSGIGHASILPPAQCEDAADVITALDRSRNGVSLTCNADIVSVGVAL